MAVIHQTTMRPGKLELLAAWLPAQPWYRQAGREPQLTRVGGFRLDDPGGEVGIEFMVVTDGSGDETIAYHVPLTYRADPLAGAEGALVGTSEHGVLGRRWIYDGAHDPVLLAQLVALIQGHAQAQAQSISHTPDPTVASQPVTDGTLALTGAASAANGPAGTDLRLAVQPGELLLRLRRVLQPDDTAPGIGSTAGTTGKAGTDSTGSGTDTAGTGGTDGESGQPCLSATWGLPDGTRVRGVFATASYSRG